MNVTDWLLVVLLLCQVTGLGVSVAFGGKLRRARELAAFFRDIASKRDQSANEWMRIADDTTQTHETRQSASRWFAQNRWEAFVYREAAEDVECFLVRGKSLDSRRTIKIEEP